VKSHLITLFIALVVGFIGGTSSQIFLSKPTPNDEGIPERQRDIPNPLQIISDTDDLALQIVQIQNKIGSLEAQLNQIAQKQTVNPANPEGTIQKLASETDPQPAVTSDLEYLAAVGLDPDVASDILRRISRQQFRSMELRNLMRSSGSSDRQRYADELRELNENRISLRTELGDERYDKYLFASRKNNRVKVNLVMAGSPAEDNGVQPGDVILYYNDKKIIDVRDLQRAALSGGAGGYGNIEILRDGNRMNLMLPHGTIGVQLQAIQIDPDQ
jgi:hypothetical protein